MKYLLTILYTFLFILPLPASERNPANYAFTKINGEIGLSQNAVKTILQDNDGFIWLGTNNKLNRFDGTSIRIFDCKDKIKNHGNNNISALHEDTNRTLWVGTDKGVFLFNPTTEIFTFFDCPTEPEGIKIVDWIADIQADKDDNIWIVVPNQGLFKYHPETKELSYYLPVRNDQPILGSPECITIEKNGRVWIGTNGEGVYLYDKETDSFEQHLGTGTNETLKGKNIYTICDYGDDLIIGVHNGKLKKLNKRRQTLQNVKSPVVHHKVTRHVTVIDNELWVGTDNGVYILDSHGNTIVNITEDPLDSKSLSDNMIEKIYQDKEGGVWIGSIYGGANYLPPKSIEFERFVPLSRKNSIHSKKINCIQEDTYGNIWIASENTGIDIYDPETGIFTHLPMTNQEQQKRIVSLFATPEHMLVGYFKDGIDVISLADKKITHYSGEQLGLNESSVYTMYKDKFDRLWLGNGWNIYVEDKESGRFVLQPQFKRGFFYDITEDSEGYIWIATMGSGVYRYDPDKDITLHFTHDSNDETSLSSNSVSSIFADNSGKVWFSTDRGGICCYNKESNNFTTYSIQDGLPDDVTYKILEDKQHNLWFGTNNGLTKFNPQTKEVRVFKQNQGLPGNQFLHKAALASGLDKFYFGGVDGLVVFNPYQFNENLYIPPVFITKLMIHNKNVKPGMENSPLKESIQYTRNITLTHDQSTISFEYVALSYAAPKSNQYIYKMEGIDPEWIHTNNPQASYTKLPPGQYTFRVKASNNDGLWNETGTFINVTVLPPWWLSTPALLIYLLTLLSGIILWSYWYTRKEKKRQAEKLQLFETEKEKELYSTKVEFFTNIAHEIRTPVTLINGPLESLLEMDIENKEVNRHLQIMQKNTSELLDLINQLLDFKKVDSNKFNPSFKRMNIIEILQELYNRFEPSATQKGKTTKLSVSYPELTIPVDKEAITKIFSNLFSNAVQYSDSIILIEVTEEEEYCTIRFSNDGERIPADKKEHIFDPFYQLERNQNKPSSSGIGLSLARSLAEVHKGELFLDITSQMNTFVLKLPIQQSDYIEDSPQNEEQSGDVIPVNNRNLPERILIVEDNTELLTFITDKLKKSYEVYGARNGVEALEFMKEKRIDLIVSDIMMPEMDGYELCKNIKSNIEYSHIPVILLTAKNDLPSKMKGLEVGADAYIEKPFSFNYFTSQITTLLTNRKREKEAFIQKPFLTTQQIGITKADEEFMERLISIINENITDENFSVESFAETLYMSRSSLHRKIKALSGLSPTDFIKSIRLKKAAEIIQEGKYSIGEVCYLVGINSPSYFTKIFQKQFGITPKEFRNKFL